MRTLKARLPLAKEGRKRYAVLSRKFPHNGVIPIRREDLTRLAMPATLIRIFQAVGFDELCKQFLARLGLIVGSLRSAVNGVEDMP